MVAVVTVRLAAPSANNDGDSTDIDVVAVCGGIDPTLGWSSDVGVVVCEATACVELEPVGVSASLKRCCSTQSSYPASGTLESVIRKKRVVISRTGAQICAVILTHSIPLTYVLVSPIGNRLALACVLDVDQRFAIAAKEAVHVLMNVRR